MTLSVTGKGGSRDENLTAVAYSLKPESVDGCERCSNARAEQGELFCLTADPGD
jgi:hypothetical protein